MMAGQLLGPLLVAVSAFSLPSLALGARVDARDAHAVTTAPEQTGIPVHIRAADTTTKTSTTTALSPSKTPTAPSVACDPAQVANPAAPCVISQFSEVARAVSCCTVITLSNLAVPGGQTLDLSTLRTGATVTFAGHTTFGYADKNIEMIKIGGTNITVTAEPNAIIDGNGQAWWDGQGSNGGVAKPNRFVTVNKVRGTSIIKNLFIRNYPVHCFGINGSSGLVLQNITLDNSAGDAPNNRSSNKAASHNSDGFGIGTSDNITLRNSTVLNQDDCVAITSGNNITVSGIYCSGSHGLSIGSIGGKSNNNVTNVLFENSVVVDSDNGVRIKSNYNTTGYVAGITYRNIELRNIGKYGLVIQQDYLNGGPVGNATNGVIIKDVTMQRVWGTTKAGGRNYYILCGDGSCQNFRFDNVTITGGAKASSCNVTPLGNFSCK